eukprot:CAMPEP_0114522416 /NCGR_PEP_ID=MMETSP0109-20121206/20727_1 /TAXON_ID=29199 /ORGANISM="Chlorarachnion reptans, Strain CCCM449" /LENGTH=223 /DNA_ID=CAMNT_0001703625 /DNA_START=92 /DNA_END=763 /DNA_ORIENTATION=+
MEVSAFHRRSLDARWTVLGQRGAPLVAFAAAVALLVHVRSGSDGALNLAVKSQQRLVPHKGPSLGFNSNYYSSFRKQYERCQPVRAIDEQKIRDEIRVLTARQIKEELDEHEISYHGIFEKSELVKLLANVRIEKGEVNELKKISEQAQEAIDKAKDNVAEKLQDTFAKLKNFDMNEELKKQARMMKENMQDNVEWYGQEKNPFMNERIIRKQRGYYKGGDKI